VTVDLLRDLLGDEGLTERAPALLAGGVPGGALTTIRLASSAWTVVDIATLDHLPEADRTGHHA